MTKKFIPSEYLNERELLLLNQTKKQIEKGDHTVDHQYFELVLDCLMANALQRKLLEDKD